MFIEFFLNFNINQKYLLIQYTPRKILDRIKYMRYKNQIITRANMIKVSEFDINKIKSLSTEIFVKFEDHGLTKEQYDFLKNRLDKYNLYINAEYSLKYQIQYNKSSKQSLIKMNIIIPNDFIPSDAIKANRILMEPINTFQLFYDAQNDIYKKKYAKNSE